MRAALQHVPKPAPVLRRAYQLLLAHFGHQGWWPGDSPLEICIGAILVQNTNWTQAELAIDRLRAQRLLTPSRLFRLEESQLADLIRPAGCPRVKARRLRAFLGFFLHECGGRWEHLWAGSVDEARHRLLSIHGVGPETADSMLLYAGRRPTFVIDAYTIRVLNRHGWASSPFRYAHLQQWCETALPESAPDRQIDLWQDCHAQLVRVAKTYCRPSQPRCDQCPLKPLLPDPACLGPADALITTAPPGTIRIRHGR